MSNVIFDCPEILSETVIELTKATKEFPIPCSRPTLERWMRKGCRGIRLETVKIGGKRYTSKEAIQRFLIRQQRIGPDEAPAPTKKSMSKKEIAEKSKRFNLPEPEEKKPKKPR